MPAIKKPSRTIFLTFLTFQLLLSVTLTSAAVIRRDKREISINVTDTTTTNNEVDSTTITTGKVVDILLYTTESSEDGITTEKSLTDIPTTDGSEEDKKELTTSIGSTIDDNTVSFAKDYRKSYVNIGRNGDYKIQEKKQQEFTTSIGSNIDDSTISFTTEDQESHIDSRDGEDKIKETAKQEFTTSIGYTVDDSTVNFVTDHQIFPIDTRGEQDKTQEKTTMESLDKSGNLETSTMNEFKMQTTGRADDIKRTESSIKELPSTTDVSAFESTQVVDDSKSPETQFTVRPEAIFKEESSAEDQSHFHSILDEEDANKSDLSTINFPDFKIETLTAQPIMQTEISTAKIEFLNEETNSQKMVDSTTADADIKLNETTNFKVIDETTTLSAIQVDEVTKIPIRPTENTSTPEDFLTELSTKPKETTDSTYNALEVLSTTGLNQAPDFITNTILPTPSTELRNFSDDVKALTSTFKSDDTTMMLTSTETSDEDPAQTTFFTNPPVYQEIRILPNASSAEKRGKFIDDNYSSQNELQLPNTSDVWALIGMKTGGKIKSSELQNSVETSDERAINNSMVTKTLLDWTRVMMSTDAMDSESTVRNSEFIPSTSTEVPVALTTTDMKLLRDNEVELLTTQTQPDITTEVTDKPEIRESTVPRENEVETKLPTKFDETTNFDEKQEVSTPEQLTDDTTLPQTDAVTNDPVPSTTKSNFKLLRDGDDVFLENNQLDDDSAEEKPPLETTSTSTTTTTTATTPVPIITTIESETTNFPDTGETTPEENTGTLLTSMSTTTLPGLSLDFTTSMPFLTSTTITTTTTTIAATTTPVTPMTTPLIAFNMDERTNEPLNMETTTLIPLQSSPITTTAATTTTTTVMEPATTTTTTITPPTTMPAVTVMAATTETETEIQTTETEAHTPAPAIFNSNNDMMTQKSNNYDNDYNSNKDEPLNKTTSNTSENSSTEATEVSTRVAPSYWATSTTETSAAEVDRFDEFDVTTLPSFEINNAFETATPQPSTTAATILTFSPPPSITTITTVGVAETSTEDLDHIYTVHKISDTGETSIESNVIDPLHVGKISTTTTTTTTTATTTTTENSQDNIRMQSTGIEELDSSSTTSTSTTTTTTTTTTPRYDDFTTTLQSISTKKEDIYAIVPTIDTGFHVPKLVLDEATTTVSSELALAGVGAGAGGQPMDSSEPQETDVNVIIAISVSVVGIVALILLVAFLYVMRKRQKQMSYGQRCRPVSLDAYSLDNVSVYNSVRRKGAALRASKRSYGNVAFDDPSLRHNVLGTHDLAKFVDKKSAIWEEFKDVPQIIARADEVPSGCEDKNRYANVIPLPETRVVLQHQNGDEKTEYINANYVRGPKDSYNYYIACQAPLETTVIDFWRMIWEQNSRVIIMATDLIENGIDKCAEYLPPSVTLDNHTVFGDFQVTLKNREVKEKYAISTLILKNTTNEECREITHYWYQWPENGVPTDEAAIIAMLLEARSSLKLSTIETSDNKTETIIIEEDPKAKNEINGNITSEKPKLPSKDQGPLTIHCSPGTGRTGTIIACDIAMRCLEEPKRCVDIPQIVYSVRRGRASAVQTKEQYEFIYKVTHMYATKISNLHNDN